MKERKKNIKGNTRNYNIFDADEVVFVFALCLRRVLGHPHLYGIEILQPT
jgi:hypothetical protein